MILEHALLTVKMGQEADFESAFDQAKLIIAEMPGFKRLALSRCIERPRTYLLLVEWDRLEDHTEGFRGSVRYQDWRNLLHHFYDPLPTVEHYEQVRSVITADRVNDHPAGPCAVPRNLGRATGDQMIDFEAFPTVQTSRLVLREIVAADAADLFAFRSDPEEQKYNDPPLRHPTEAQDLIARLAREYQQQCAIHWGLTLKGSDIVVGLLGYHYWNRPHWRAGIGYDLKRELWGRGLMPEALQAVIRLGFERMGLNRIEAHTNTENTSSVRMLRKLGFWQEGTLHEHFYEDGSFHDVSLFVMLRRDSAASGDVNQPAKGEPSR